MAGKKNSEGEEKLVDRTEYQIYLDEFKKLYGMSNAQISEIIGVSQKEISKWSWGKVVPRMESWYKAVKEIEAWQQTHPYNELDQCSEILQSFKKEYQLTSTELAEIIGVAPSTVWRWCSRKSVPKYEVWADILECIAQWKTCKG